MVTIYSYGIDHSVRNAPYITISRMERTYSPPGSTPYTAENTFVPNRNNPRTKSAMVLINPARDRSAEYSRQRA